MSIITPPNWVRIDNYEKSRPQKNRTSCGEEYQVRSCLNELKQMLTKRTIEAVFTADAPSTCMPVQKPSNF